MKLTECQKHEPAGVFFLPKRKLMANRPKTATTKFSDPICEWNEDWRKSRLLLNIRDRKGCVSGGVVGEGTRLHVADKWKSRTRWSFPCDCDIVWIWVSLGPSFDIVELQPNGLPSTKKLNPNLWAHWVKRF